MKYIKITPLFTQVNIALLVPILRLMPGASPALIGYNLTE
jgi:hypothetical protein